jgi:excisionase family DNA binding protein
MPETFLTVEQAARELQVTPYTLREWLKARRLRGVKIGGYWRVPAVALEELANGTDDADANALDEADARRVLAETPDDAFIPWDTAKAALDAAPEAS